jgi:hypothetical protein
MCLRLPDYLYALLLSSLWLHLYDTHIFVWRLQD